MKKVLLCGYMGCGKSTVATILSAKTHLPKIDLDELLVNSEGMSITDIFEKKGEVYFRKLEHRVFTELMRRPDPFVLALGGGTPAYANNHLLMKGEGVVSFFLRASIDTLYERLAHDGAHRPLVAQKSSEELKEYIAKHLFDRNFYYAQADFTLSADGKTAEEVADEIASKLA